MNDGIARIEAAFTSAVGAAFIPYVMTGYPDLETSVGYASVMARYADVIELGVPFSDPLADGPVIQAAGQVALEAGTTPAEVLRVADRLRNGPPVVIMTYLNTVLAPGPADFFADCAAAGVAGILIPDLPLEESDEIRAAAHHHGVALVPFAAPTSSDARLAAIGSRAEGFVYCVAVTGVTGGGITIDDAFTAFLTRARRHIAAPLAVGFGVRTPDDASRVGSSADGVIIGSELIRIVNAAASPAAAERALDEYARSIKQALQRSR